MLNNTQTVLLSWMLMITSASVMGAEDQLLMENFPILSHYQSADGKVDYYMTPSGSDNLGYFLESQDKFWGSNFNPESSGGDQYSFCDSKDSYPYITDAGKGIKCVFGGMISIGYSNENIPYIYDYDADIASSLDIDTDISHYKEWQFADARYKIVEVINKYKLPDGKIGQAVRVKVTSQFLGFPEYADEYILNTRNGILAFKWRNKWFYLRTRNGILGPLDEMVFNSQHLINAVNADLLMRGKEMVSDESNHEITCKTAKGNKLLDMIIHGEDTKK